MSGALVEGTGTRRPSPSKDEMTLLCASLLGLAIVDLVKAEVAACTAEPYPRERGRFTEMSDRYTNEFAALGGI